MSTDETTWTILRLLKWTEDFLRNKQFESPRLEAEILLAAARKCKRIDLYTAYDEVASDEVRTAFRELVRRRSEGTPVAYLTGTREFYSRSFRVTPDVLIPRPETEFVVIEMLDRTKHQLQHPWSIADVGTGSGVLAVNAALELPNATVTAIDRSPAAINVARQNAEDHQVADRIRFVESDLFAELPSSETYDVVISNPPYVSQAEYDQLDPHVRDFEPQLALLAGEHGMDVMERLVPQSAERLNPQGWLMMEISPMIHDRVCQLIHDHGGYLAPKTSKDLSQLARVVSAQRK